MSVSNFRTGEPELTRVPLDRHRTAVLNATLEEAFRRRHLASGPLTTISDQYQRQPDHPPVTLHALAIIRPTSTNITRPCNLALNNAQWWVKNCVREVLTINSCNIINPQ